LLIGLLVLPSLAGAQVRVFLLPDAPDCPADPRWGCDGVVTLADALHGAGHQVTLGPLEFLWDATNPTLDGFDAVVHLNGATFHTPLPRASQLALEEFVRTGGGYVGSQFNGFELYDGRQVDMPNLVLQLWPLPDNCSEFDMTWTVVPGQETHPMLDGVPASFTFFSD
jgi:hypothetical protein